ncbi:carbohydrate ABC transporter substrate-binding protein [Vagococcus sp. BWB3-3]|uniref:Carbohydrate ABC transporter substrate-binding protein n=1 Tax=Vagococcus allomyrinae TaxID=2794353 RepID=A0A940PD57_9ENTE|nr:ABC transporter substrate-binding protein [Vagococcus allomyrinae]MBP1042392.1 carbohydrate ABC transporter substrate-binding protein [Vagococcus allomyrinae]
MKKRMTLLVMVMLATMLVACGKNQGDGGGETKKELVVWTFTDEIETMVKDYYQVEHPDLNYEIKFVVTPSDQFQTKLDPIIGTDKAPDVVALESSFVKKYVESGLLADLDALKLDQASKDTYEYIKEVGTSADGTLRALSWQATPGAFFYRASLAKEFLKVDSPAEFQALVTDFDQFYETAKLLKEQSKGKVYMISSVSDLLYPFEVLRKTGWVKDDQLYMDQQMIDLMELGKKLVSEKLTLDTEYRSEAWYAGMASDTIMGYPLPTWGLHYWLQPNSEAESGESTFGDWQMVQGPAAYFSGGTWVGISQQSTMKAEAAELIKFITTDATFLEAYTREVGDVVSNRQVVDKVKGEFENDFLGGQNHYEEFAKMIETISAETITEYDRTIDTLYQDEALIPYSKDEVDKETAIANFKAAVQNSYPDIKMK